MDTFCAGEEGGKSGGSTDKLDGPGALRRSPPSAAHPADRRRGASERRPAQLYRDIAHCDVSSYFWLIRAIMSPALIYVVIPPQQSCIDRS